MTQTLSVQTPRMQSPNGTLGAEIEAKTFFEEVELNKLFVPAYGRPMSNNKVQSLVNKWHTPSVGTLYLSLRPDGSYAIMDGAHRTAAAIAVGLHRLPARIWIDLSYEEEARYYVRFATVNKQSALDRFRAKVEAGDPDAMIIQSVCKRVGIPVATYRNQTNAIQAVNVVETIYQRFGADFLGDVVGIVFEAFEYDSKAWTRNVLDGMALFWARYHNDARMSRTRLIRRLKETGVQRLITKGVEITGALSESGHAGYGRSILQAYNFHLTEDYRLPDWATRIMPAPAVKTKNLPRGRHAQNADVPAEPVIA